MNAMKINNGSSESEEGNEEVKQFKGDYHSNSRLLLLLPVLLLRVVRVVVSLIRKEMRDEQQQEA